MARSLPGPPAVPCSATACTACARCPPKHSPPAPKQVWSWKYEQGSYRVASLAETSATSTEGNAVQVGGCCNNSGRPGQGRARRMCVEDVPVA